MDYNEDITKYKWLYRPDIQLIRYNIDLTIDNWNVPQNRKNPFFYCYWNKTLGAEIHVGNKIYPITPNNIMLIPPNLEHSPVQKSSFNHSFIHFIAPFPFNTLDRIEQIPIDQSIQLFQRCNLELHTSLSLYSFIFGLLLKVPPKHYSPKQIKDKRILQACSILSSGSIEKLQLENLASKLNMSVSNLCHLFKQEVGVSPISYAMEKRMEKSLIMLADCQNSIDDIAKKNGFSNRYHFSKAFKSYYGVPPVKMRKSLVAST
jgi:AraC-like DNA-binding protein